MWAFLFQLKSVICRIYRINFIVNKLKKAVLQNKSYFSKQRPKKIILNFQFAQIVSKKLDKNLFVPAR